MAKKVDLSALSLDSQAPTIGSPALAVNAEWTLYFEDGSTYSSLDGSPQNAPLKPIVCIGVRPYQYTLWSAPQNEWFYWNSVDRSWWASDTYGLLYQLCKNASRIGAVRRCTALSADHSDMMWRAYQERMGVL